MKADNPFDLLLPPAAAKVAEEAGVYKATKRPSTTFFLAITAGVFISIAFVFYITAATGTAAVPYGFAKLIDGFCFSLGLMLLIISGADLFTSSVLIVVARASGRISWAQLVRNWINVYIRQPDRRTVICGPHLVCGSAYSRQRRLGSERIADRRS